MPPSADEYRAGLLLLQQQQRAKLTALIEQVDGALSRDWQRSMGYAAALYRPVIDAYARELAALRTQMDDPSAKLTLDWLTSRNSQLATIERSVRASLDTYGQQAAARVTSAQAASAERGAADAAQLTQRSLWPAVEGAGVPPAMLFNRPNPDAIAQWVGRAGNGHPLGDLFANFGTEATQLARKEMLLGLATGANPKAMAAGIANALGVSRSRATIISRTEVLGSYRSAAHEIYRANADVINGWLWSAGGNNPCFPAGTLIATKRGRVAIEDVVVGDLVLTHRGQFRRVTEIMSRTYRGPMTTLEAEDGRRVMATASHPFLVERQGQLDWIEAGQLRLSDGVVSEHERTTKIIDHRLSDDPIEGRIRQSHNPVALALEIERLAHIAGSSARVPVDAIDLQHGVERGQIEVNRIAPTTDHELLPIVDSQSLKTEARSPFWLGLTRMASIATDGAEATARYLTRLGTDFLATLKTSEGLRGASALLRAIMPPNRNAHDLATPGTGPERVVVGDGSATDTGSGAVDTTSSLTALDAERVAALRADLLNVVRSNVAVSGAVLPPAAAMISQKHLAALTTNALNGGVRNLPAHGMRVSPLMLGVAGSGAKAPIASRVARGRDIEGDAAVLTDAFHIQSITRIAHHIQQSGLMVFNLEVEGDQTYVANGFAVHNCAMCMGMDGLQFSLEEELIDHPCGKCSPIPITRSWDDILGSWGIDSEDMLETSMGAPGAYESGEERFARMSAQQQRAIIGTRTGYDAYKRGEVTLRDFVGMRPAEHGWPAMPYQKSLKEMEIPTGRAGSNLVERAPRLTELKREGNLRYRDFGAPIPPDEMPKWAQQSPATEAVYQILRNGLPWSMRDQELPLLAQNLEQMLKEELPLNVRLAALRQQDVLAQYEQYLNRYVRNVTTNASTLGKAPEFVYTPSKELERLLAAARAGERGVAEAVTTEAAAPLEHFATTLPEHLQTPESVQSWLHEQYPHIRFDLAAENPYYAEYGPLFASGEMQGDIEKELGAQFMSPEMARTIGAEFHQLAQEYPDAIKDLEYVGLRDGVTQAEAERWGGFVGGGLVHAGDDGQFLVLSNEWRDLAALDKSLQLNIGYTLEGENSPAGIFTHEFGHLVEHAVQDLTPEQRAIYEAWAEKYPFKESAVSQYARKTANEHFAETFAAVQFGSPEIRALSEVRDFEAMLQQIQPSKELERTLAAARAGERGAFERTVAQEVAQRATGRSLTEAETRQLIDMNGMPGDRARIAEAAYSRIADKLADNPAWANYLATSGKAPEQAIEDLATIFRGTILEGEGNAANVGAMMRAVRDELGLTDARAGVAESLADAEAIYARDGAALRAYVRAAYEDTQQYFRDQGISEITLFRGGSVGDKPFNSFSVDRERAAIYGKSVREVSVPVEQILGLPQSGIGNAVEGEVIVLSHSPADLERALAAARAGEQTASREAIQATKAEIKVELGRAATHIAPEDVETFAAHNAPDIPSVGFHYGTPEHIGRLGQEGIDVARNRVGAFGRGFYMFVAENPNDAFRYGEDFVRVAIHMENPYRIMDGEAYNALLDKYIDANTGVLLIDWQERLTADLLKQGYDGIYVSGVFEDGPPQIVAIKSGTVRVIKDSSMTH